MRDPATWLLGDQLKLETIQKKLKTIQKVWEINWNNTESVRSCLVSYLRFKNAIVKTPTKQGLTYLKFGTTRVYAMQHPKKVQCYATLYSIVCSFFHMTHEFGSTCSSYMMLSVFSNQAHMNQMSNSASSTEQTWVTSIIGFNKDHSKVCNKQLRHVHKEFFSQFLKFGQHVSETLTPQESGSLECSHM